MRRYLPTPVMRGSPISFTLLFPSACGCVQPHLFTRTRDFLREFAESLSAADHVIITDIYPAREEPIPGVTSDKICAEAEKLGYKNFEYVGTKDHAIDAVARVAKPGDMVITIGAGSITHIKKQILERLQKS